MAQDVGMVWKCCGVIDSFGWFLRLPSLHALVFLQKTFCDLSRIKPPSLYGVPVSLITCGLFISSQTFVQDFRGAVGKWVAVEFSCVCFSLPLSYPFLSYFVYHSLPLLFHLPSSHSCFLLSSLLFLDFFPSTSFIPLSHSPFPSSFQLSSLLLSSLLSSFLSSSSSFLSPQSTLKIQHPSDKAEQVEWVNWVHHCGEGREPQPGRIS